MHISSSYAKILGEKLFHTWEIPRSGSKAEDGEREREKERAKVGENNGQATHGARKHAWRTQAAWANFHTQTCGLGQSGIILGLIHPKKFRDPNC